MGKDHSDSEREKTSWRHMGCYFRLAARVLLYASSHRQDNTYRGLCYTSRGALAGKRTPFCIHFGVVRQTDVKWKHCISDSYLLKNRSMGPPWGIDPTFHRTTSERSHHGVLHEEVAYFKLGLAVQYVNNRFISNLRDIPTSHSV